ncbi:MAG: hypothetical protein PUA81_02010 [Oscillospiraceae bacterium]|nr:hypothetical protein [Oscillospiraceae bacterium]
MNDSVSQSWFAVFNNPAEHGYDGEPEEICEKLRDEWINESDTRSGAWAYCVSADGLHHVHMVLCDEKKMRFSAVKKEYCIGMHFEATKGTKKQADDYINKRGAFAEKGEKILYILYHGEIKGRQGHRSDLEEYYSRLKSGETPAEIMHSTPKAYVHKSLLKTMYFDLLSENTPIVRDVKVYWHIGSTGSGKSYERITLAKEIGENNIYYLSSFNSGAFDDYMGEKVLWIDDLRSEFKLQELLRYLDVYKCSIPCRYTNGKALWNEVHITTPLTPQALFYDPYRNQSDSIDQLIRRITSIVYHFSITDSFGNTEYHKLYFSPYESLNKMLVEVKKSKDFLSQWTLILGVDENEKT